MISGGHDTGFNKLKTINRRMFIFSAAKAVIFFGIVGRLFSLQISENKKYLTLSDKNKPCKTIYKTYSSKHGYIYKLKFWIY